jgi:hypothetical protein
VVAAAVLVLAPSAPAAQLLARSISRVTIAVNTRQIAAISFTSAGGRRLHSLVWGARNAIAPDPRREQRRFLVNYAGGYGTFLGAGYWRRVVAGDVCRRYGGPPLPRIVAACTMLDGSHWAVQAWHRLLPNLGWDPRTAEQRAIEYHVSHWDGPLPQLWLKADWFYAGAAGGPFDHLYGRLSYRGHPVYGFRASPTGAPLDRFGRLIYLDTRHPPWTAGYRQDGGWYRQNSFLTHNPRGDFCPGVLRTVGGVPPRARPGRGDRYRAYASGPGVTPVVGWSGPPPGYYRPGLANLEPARDERGPYDADLDRRLNEDQKQLAGAPRSTASCWYTH